MKALLMLEYKKGIYSTLFVGMSLIWVLMLTQPIFNDLFMLYLVTSYFLKRLWVNPHYRLEFVLPIRRNTLYLYRLICGMFVSLLISTLLYTYLKLSGETQTAMFLVLERLVYIIPFVILVYTDEETSFRTSLDSGLATVGIIIVGLLVIFKTQMMDWPMERLALRALWMVPLLAIGLIINYRGFDKSGYGFIKGKKKRRKTT